MHHLRMLSKGLRQFLAIFLSGSLAEGRQFRLGQAGQLLLALLHHPPRILQLFPQPLHRCLGLLLKLLGPPPPQILGDLLQILRLPRALPLESLQSPLEPPPEVLHQRPHAPLQRFHRQGHSRQAFLNVRSGHLTDLVRSR
jgi:hypothetical protein